MIVADLLLAFAMVHVRLCIRLTSLRERPGPAQPAPVMSNVTALLCHAKWLCMYVLTKGTLNPHRVVEGHLGLSDIPQPA